MAYQVSAGGATVKSNSGSRSDSQIRDTRILCVPPCEDITAAACRDPAFRARSEDASSGFARIPVGERYFCATWFQHSGHL